MSSQGNLTPPGGINSIPTWQLCIAALGVVLLVMVGIVLFKIYQSPDNNRLAGVDWKNTSSDAVFRESLIDDTHTITTPYTPPEPERTPPPLSADEAFITAETPTTTTSVSSTTNTTPTVDYTAFRRAQLRLNHQRRVASQITYVKPPAAVLSPESVSTPEAQLKAEDFSEHGIKKDTSTYPVDLERTITSDRYIPCILIDQIHSQLEGMATCQVEQNVYGYHGRNILIPVGSRVIGTYATLEKVGMERFELQWTRIIRPDGAHIALSNAYAADQIGQSGLTGDVDNRMFDKYGMAIITASFSTLMQASMNVATEEGDINNSVIENYGTDLGQVTAAMLEATMNIKPYAVVPSGTRLFIRSQTDIWLKETESGGLAFSTTDEPQSEKTNKDAS